MRWGQGWDCVAQEGFCSYLLSLIFIQWCSSHALSTGYAFCYPCVCPHHAVWFSLLYTLVVTRGILSRICIPTAWDISMPKCWGGDRNIRWRGRMGRMREWLSPKPGNLALLCPCWAPALEDKCLVFSNTHSGMGLSFCRPWIFRPPQGETGFSRVKWIIYLAN